LASRTQWEEHSQASHSGGEGHREPESNRREAERSNRENRTKNLDSSFLLVDEIGNIMPKMLEAALMVAQAYLLTKQPALGDPRESMHQAAIKGLRLIGDKLQQKLSTQDKSPHEQQKERRSRRSQSPQTRRSKSPKKGNYDSRGGDARNIITQARINRSRYKWDKGNYEDEETEMGALCFTRRVRKTQVPKGFKLPHDQRKYDGSQEPELWLSDYLQAVKILGGSRATECKTYSYTSPAQHGLG
jgi:hypothetical protein